MGRDRLQPEVAYENAYVLKLSMLAGFLEEKHLHCEHFIWNSCTVE